MAADSRRLHKLLVPFFVGVTCFCIYTLEVGDESLLWGNESAHYWQVHGFLEGRFWVEKPPCRFDAARYRGRCYSNKPPGYPLLLTPAAYPVYALVGSPSKKAVQQVDYRQLRIYYRLFSALAAALAAAVIAWMIQRHWHTLGGRGRRARAAALFGGFALGLGTILHPYATTHTAHAFTALFFAVAIWLLVRYREQKGTIVAIVAAAAIAYTPLIESKNALFAAPLGLLLFGLADSWRDRVAIALAVVPCAAVFFGFNWLAFGDPLSTGYDHYVPKPYIPWTDETFGNFGNNPITNLPRVLFHPGRGILFLSPLLALAPLGLFRWYRRDRLVGGVVTGGIVLYLLVLSSYVMWHGAHSFGHRHFFPLLPALVVAAAVGMSGNRWLRRFAVAALGVSVALVTTGVFIHLAAVHATWVNEPADRHGTLTAMLEIVLKELEREPTLLRHFLPAVWTVYAKLAALAVLFGVQGWWWMRGAEEEDGGTEGRQER